MVSFSSPKELGPKDWGQELLVAHTDSYTGKIMHMQAGRGGALQYHKEKDESAYLFSGDLLFQYQNEDGKVVEKVLHPGDCVHIPPGSVHQETAITDCIIFETSTPHFEDRVLI